MPTTSQNRGARRAQPKAPIRTQSDLIQAARDSGLQVKTDCSGHTTIVRNRNRGVRIWADKVIHDLHVEPSVAARLNIADATKLLQLQ